MHIRPERKHQLIPFSHRRWVSGPEGEIAHSSGQGPCADIEYGIACKSGLLRPSSWMGQVAGALQGLRGHGGVRGPGQKPGPQKWPRSIWPQGLDYCPGRRRARQPRAEARSAARLFVLFGETHRNEWEAANPSGLTGFLDADIAMSRGKCTDDFTSGELSCPRPPVAARSAYRSPLAGRRQSDHREAERRACSYPTSESCPGIVQVPVHRSVVVPCRRSIQQISHEFFHL